MKENTRDEESSEKGIQKRKKEGVEERRGEEELREKVRNADCV